MSEILKNVIKYKGPKGLWMGLSSTLLRDVPFSAIYWFNYESFKLMFSNHEQNFTFNLIGGAIAGSVNTIYSLNLDILFFLICS